MLGKNFPEFSSYWAHIYITLPSAINFTYATTELNPSSLTLTNSVIRGNNNPIKCHYSYYAHEETKAQRD